MEEQYDAIVLGTGLKEGVLSALLSVHGKKVLHMDRNDYYGGECASLHLKQVYEHFHENLETIPPTMGKDSDWNIDMVPKFMLSAGDMFRALRHADCLNYLDFGKVAGSFVYSKGDIHRVPASVKDALASKLMGLFEKKRMASMLQDINDYVCGEKKPFDRPLDQMTVSELFASYKLDPETTEFILHAMALYDNDSVMDQPALETVKKIALYGTSMNRFGSSPYIYPLYGLADIPQAFARLAAVWGGTYMLDKQIDQILFDEKGHVCGIQSGEEKAYAPLVIGDPSYFKDMVKSVSKVGRGIAILKGPIEKCAKNSDVDKDKDGKVIEHTSAQVIVLGSQLTPKRDDIYVTTQGYNHRTTPKGFCLGFVSGTVGSDNPDELKKGWEILESAGIIKKFYEVKEIYEPINYQENEKKGVFISKSYDATSHFESSIADALELYERITGSKLDLDSKIVRPPIPGMENVEAK